MKKGITFAYVLFGFILGWVIGRIDSSSIETSYKHLFFMICCILILRALFWLDDSIQKRVKNNWTVVRAKGKIRYIMLYAMFIRGGLFFVLLFVLPFLTIGFDHSVIKILIPSLIILVGFLYLLGSLEWRSNELTELEKTQ
jgi:hypothetical protein